MSSPKDKRKTAANSSTEAHSHTHNALRSLPSMPDDAFVDIGVVMAILSRSRASVLRDVKAERIPKPYRVGVRSVRWKVGELRAALAHFTA